MSSRASSSFTTASRASYPLTPQKRKLTRSERQQHRTACFDQSQEEATRKKKILHNSQLVASDSEADDDEEENDEGDGDDDESVAISMLGIGKENRRPGQSTRMVDEKMDLLVETKIDPADSLPTPRVTPSKKMRNRLDLALASTSASLSALSSIPPQRFSNVYDHAIHLLSTSAILDTTSASLPFLGREKETTFITKFLARRFDNIYDHEIEEGSATLPSLYISGPPGIGKTASLISVLADFVQRTQQQRSETTVRVHMENCSSIGSIGLEASMWSRFGAGLGLWEGKCRGQSQGREDFVNGLFASDTKFLLVLDEIDHVLTATHSHSTSHQNLLNSLFAIAHTPSSPLTIIGIANALDLTTRSLHLTRLSVISDSSPSSSAKGKAKAKVECDGVGPVLLHYEPYQASEISKIIRQRLSLLVDSYPFNASDSTIVSRSTYAGLALLNPAALELCTKKVERATGDIRTSLEIVRNAIGTIKRNEIRKLDSTGSGSSSSPLSTPSKSSSSSSIRRLDDTLLSHLTPFTAPKASFPQIMSALTLAGLNTPETLATKLAQLTFSARNALVGVIIALSRVDCGGAGRTATIELREAFEVYREVILHDGTINALSRADFRGTVDLALESFVSVTSPARTPTKSSKHSAAGGGRRIDNSGSEPLVSLPSHLSLTALTEALKTTPSTCAERKTSAGAMEETMRISINLLTAEERRVLGSKRMKKFDEMAPKAGFHGDGLDRGTAWMGEKKKRVEKEEEQGEGEAGSRW